MRAGQMRHKVTLQELGARIDDGAGGGSIPFVDAAEGIWASIEPLFGRELLLAGQMDTRLTHRVRTRYVPGVRPHWRVVYGDTSKINAEDASERPKIFDIDTVIDPEEKHRELELMCVEMLTW